MNVEIKYTCLIFIDRLGEKYRGMLILNLVDKFESTHEVVKVGKRFWFILHFPNNKSLAEVAFYTNKEMTDPLAEGIASDAENNNSDSGEIEINYLFDTYTGKAEITKLLLFMLLKSVAIIEQGIKVSEIDATDQVVGLTGLWSNDYSYQDQNSAFLLMKALS